MEMSEARKQQLLTMLAIKYPEQFSVEEAEEEAEEE